MLAQEVKNVQKDPVVKQKWQDYCAIFGNNQRDPNQHNETFLSGFLQGLQSVISDANIIFVGGLPHDINDQLMMQYFSQFGEVAQIQLKLNKGFGFVTFKSPDSVELIMSNFGHQINGKAIDCKRKQAQVAQPMMMDPTGQLQQQTFGPVRTQIRQPLGPYVTSPMPVQQQAPRTPYGQGPAPDGVIQSTEIFVGGLPIDITEQLLLEYFSQFGFVSKVELKEGKGYAFIGFTASDAVELITNPAQMHQINGKQIACKKRVLDALQQAKAKGQHLVMPFQGIQQQQPMQMQQQPQFFRKFNTMPNQGGVVQTIPKMPNPAPGEVVPSKIFVGGLPHGTREEHLMEAFQLFGNIVQIDCKHEKGFGFVHFENPESVSSVMAQAGAIIVGGQLVDCKPADNRPPKLALLEQQQLQQQVQLQPTQQIIA